MAKPAPGVALGLVFGAWCRRDPRSSGCSASTAHHHSSTPVSEPPPQIVSRSTTSGGPRAWRSGRIATTREPLRYATNSYADPTLRAVLGVNELDRDIARERPEPGDPASARCVHPDFAQHWAWRNGKSRSIQ